MRVKQEHFKLPAKLHRLATPEGREEGKGKENAKEKEEEKKKEKEKGRRRSL